MKPKIVNSWLSNHIKIIMPCHLMNIKTKIIMPCQTDNRVFPEGNLAFSICHFNERNNDVSLDLSIDDSTNEISDCFFVPIDRSDDSTNEI